MFYSYHKMKVYFISKIFERKNWWGGGPGVQHFLQFLVLISLILHNFLFCKFKKKSDIAPCDLDWGTTFKKSMKDCFVIKTNDWLDQIFCLENGMIFFIRWYQYKKIAYHR